MIFTSGLIFPEGPVALLDGSWLCVQGEPAGCITRISPDGQLQQVIAKTGRPNGLAVDRNGFIWVAESRIPSLLKVAMSGEVEIVHTGCGDEAFLFPNDCCFGPDGFLYLTDSGVFIDAFAPGGKIRSDYDTVPCDGRIYRINTHTGEIIKIDSGIRFTNGIAFGPDGYLYANETLTGNVFRYRVEKNTAGKREFFGNVINPAAPTGYKGPDGMAFDENGRLYVTVFGQGDVTVLDNNGDVAMRIPTKGMNPTNIAFARQGKKQAHVTEYQHGNMELLNTAAAGLALWD
jgi:gluconolactonase